MPTAGQAGQGLMMSMYRSMGKVGWLGSAAIGGAIGGAMGGLSQDRDSSMLSGALKGALIGAAAYGLGRRGLQGAAGYQRLRQGGMGAGQALSKTLSTQAKITGAFFGIRSKMTKAVNPIKSGLKAGISEMGPSVSNYTTQLGLPGISGPSRIGPSIRNATQMGLPLTGGGKQGNFRWAARERLARIRGGQNNRKLQNIYNMSTPRGGQAELF